MCDLKFSKRYFTIGTPIRKAMPSEYRYKIYREFEEYQRNNYVTKPLDCICGNDNSYLISNVDREGFAYPLVICRSCGLIRAKEYWNLECTKDFYTNWYRKKYGEEDDPSNFYNGQTKKSRNK